MKAKINLENIYSYLLGNYRYKIYNSKYFKWLMRTHIRQQIDHRIRSMERKCYTTGTCILCGCDTTALQMANKACDKPCYPIMMTRKQWKHINKVQTVFYYDKGTKERWRIFGGKFYMGQKGDKFGRYT